MASVKFPNVPKPIVGACSDGFPKPLRESQSECSEFICFQEPLFAFQPTKTVDAQVPRSVNPNISNPQPQFQPDVKPAVSQPSFVFDDPWSEDVDHVATSYHTQQLPSKNPFSVKFPTLFKVGEDPYDPWNTDDCDLEHCTQLPCFGGESKPKTTERSSTFEPNRQPSLAKAGETDHDPWNTWEQLYGVRNPQPTMQSFSSKVVDTRNAL